MSAYVTIQTYKPQGKYNYMHKNIFKIFMHVKRTNTEAHRSEVINSECRSGLPYSYTSHPGPHPRHPRGYAGRICTYHRR